MNRLSMRSPIVPYSDSDSARSGERTQSPWFLSLNGTWSIRRFNDVSEVSASELTCDISQWNTILVPGNWTLAGLGDEPHYTNVVMPWSGRPPSLPDSVATAVHRTSFTVPQHWEGRRTIVHIGGAESVHMVYVNGSFVGYGTDSRLPSEYDISEFIADGENKLAIVVCRYSAQSHLEDQDQWWMAGLHREVFLRSQAPVAIHDARVDAGLLRDEDAAPSGSLKVAVTLDVPRENPLAPGWKVIAQLETFEGKTVGRARTQIVPAHEIPYVFEGYVVTFDNWVVPNVKMWSAEMPTRYRVVISLVAPGGESTEVTSVVTGFRSVQVVGNALLINGERVMIRGVNRHDHHPDKGKAVSREDMRADLVLMKQNNINAVRCSHYPNDSQFLDLCDELGLYVVDEANAECHAWNTSLVNNADYRNTWISRITRMVERDKNHPSIIMWSLGNEAGYGAVHDAAAQWIRTYDPSRPLHYEGAIFHAGWDDGGRVATDVVCPMYAPIDAIVAYGKKSAGKRPLIMCEYSHAMGNSNGSLSDYWHAFENTPGLQGGFVWEWKDHGLTQTTSSGATRFAFGGQFGDTPNDGNFVADGLVHADLTPHPAMRELAWVHRPVWVTLGGTRNQRHLIIRNRQWFTDLAPYVATWELIVDGESVRRGKLAVPTVAPDSSVVIDLPVDISDDAREAFLNVTWALKKDTVWAAAGHVVSWDQVVLRSSKKHRVPLSSTNVDTASLDLAPCVTVWRAAVDNDGFKMMPHLWPGFGRSLERWLSQGIATDDASVLASETTMTYRSDGSVRYEHVVDVPEALADLPRVGATFEVPKRFTQVRYYGRGPHENYPDRNASAMIGIYDSAPDELPYLVPQEFGLRTECRWMELVDPISGDVLRIDADGVPLHMSAIHYTSDDLYRANDRTELVARPHLVVHVDVAHRGLGTASCGPDTLPGYRIGSGEFRFAYVVSLMRGNRKN